MQPVKADFFCQIQPLSERRSADNIDPRVLRQTRRRANQEVKALEVQRTPNAEHHPAIRNTKFSFCNCLLFFGQRTQNDFPVINRRKRITNDLFLRYAKCFEKLVGLFPRAPVARRATNQQAFDCARNDVLFPQNAAVQLHFVWDPSRFQRQNGSCFGCVAIIRYDDVIVYAALEKRKYLPVHLALANVPVA